jgi:5'-3' exonuclease
METKKYKILLLDGTNFFIKHYFGNKSIDNFGMICGGLVGFILGLKNLIVENTPDEIIIVFDGANNSKHKRKVDESYKKGRKTSYVDINPQDNEKIFDKQLSKLYMFLTYTPIKVFNMENVEADNVIGYLYYLLNKIDDNFEINIISNDNDFYQLINENTTVIDHKKKQTIDLILFEEEYGFKPYNYHIYKSMAGDHTDNVHRILNKKKIFELFNDILQSERVYHITEIENYIKEKNIEIDLDKFRDNYSLVDLHESNIGLNTKQLISGKLKNTSNKSYGLTDLKVMIKIYGIEKFIYPDFFSYMNFFKLKNNKFTKYFNELIK